jgi:hypothetical protein
MFSNKGQFGFIKIIIIGLMFILFFGFLAGTVSDSTEIFTSTWGTEYPFVSWLYSGLNVWIFIGGLLGIIGGLVWGLNLTGD